jgi:hypothetical protein
MYVGLVEDDSLLLIAAETCGLSAVSLSFDLTRLLLMAES